MHGVLAHCKVYFRSSKELKRTALHVLGCAWLIFAQQNGSGEAGTHKGSKEAKKTTQRLETPSKQKNWEVQSCSKPHYSI